MDDGQFKRESDGRKVLGVLLAMGIVFWLAMCSNPDSAPVERDTSPRNAPVDLGQLNGTLRSMPLEGRWAAVEFEEASRSAFKVGLTYAVPPNSLAQVEADTRAVATQALSAIQAAGISPHRDRIFLSVWARRPVKGVTGADMVTIYGATRYEAQSDSLSFEPMK